MTVNTGINEVAELGWDDEIVDENTFVLLPEGKYDFVVKQVERGRHEPKQGGKIPACNKAIVHLGIMYNGTEIVIKDNHYLLSDRTGFISKFFVAIGMMEEGGKLRMNWAGAVGKTGEANVIITSHNGNDYNNIKTYVLPSSGSAKPAVDSVW